AMAAEAPPRVAHHFPKRHAYAHARARRGVAGANKRQRAEGNRTLDLLEMPCGTCATAHRQCRDTPRAARDALPRSNVPEAKRRFRRRIVATTSLGSRRSPPLSHARPRSLPLSPAGAPLASPSTGLTSTARTDAA